MQLEPKIHVNSARTCRVFQTESTHESSTLVRRLDVAEMQCSSFARVVSTIVGYCEALQPDMFIKYFGEAAFKRPEHVWRRSTISDNYLMPTMSIIITYPLAIDDTYTGDMVLPHSNNRGFKPLSS